MTFLSSLFDTYTNNENLLPVFILITIALILLCTQYVLYRSLKRFLSGSNAQSLEGKILEVLDEIAMLKKHDTLLGDHAFSLEKRLQTSVRNISMLRFKALETNASTQSFSVALLNEHGDGVVLSSLHVRDRVTTYAKPIENYISTHELTDEEKEVIEKVKKDHTVQ